MNGEKLANQAFRHSFIYSPILNPYLVDPKGTGYITLKKILSQSDRFPLDSGS